MNCIENEKCTIYAKVNDNCRIGGFSKPEFKNYIDLIIFLTNHTINLEDYIAQNHHHLNQDGLTLLKMNIGH